MIVVNTLTCTFIENENERQTDRQAPNFGHTDRWIDRLLTDRQMNKIRQVCFFSSKATLQYSKHHHIYISRKIGMVKYTESVMYDVIKLRPKRKEVRGWI